MKRKMKTQLIILTFIISLFSIPAFSELLFKDNFTVSSGGGNINYNYFDVDRQSGSLAPAEYKHWFPSFNSTLVTNAGPTAGKLYIYYINESGETNTEWVGGPNINFTNSGNFAIEFKVKRLSTNADSKVCLSFGKDHVPASYWTGGGMSFEIFGSGKCILFKENDQQIGQLWLQDSLSSEISPEIKVKYVVSQSGFPSTNDAKVALFINDVPYNFGTGGDFVYIYQNGFSDNYINFQTWNDDFEIDYLKVTAADGNSFHVTNWINDADTGISPEKSYTHLLDFANNTNTIVNGVTFIGTGIEISGTNWLTKANNEQLWRYGMADLEISPNVTGAGRQLVTNALYNVNYDPAFVLKGLIPNQEYLLTLYCQGLHETQPSYVATSDGEAISLVDESAYGASNGVLITYQYTANEDGCFSLATTTIDFSPWALYALSNEEIPEPFLMTAVAFITFILTAQRKYT